ncbi:MAG: hypothetical protein ACI92E_003224 [Oceanicoccus sp.]|jgi:hypothetical protein
MVNFTTINNTNRSSSVSRKTARRNVNASSEAAPRNQHTLERRAQVDRRLTKGEKRIMDRRNMRSRRRSSINLSV